MLWGCVIIASLAVGVVVLTKALHDVRADRDRLRQNQNVLLHNGQVEIGNTSTGESMASTPAVNLSASEFSQSNDPLVSTAKSMKVKPKRVAEAATAATETEASISAPLTPAPASEVNPVVDSVDGMKQPSRILSYTDAWLSVYGVVSDSTFQGTVISTDTLDIIVHRVPHRFLFFRFGTKGVQMNISSRNPHTRLTYVRFYKLLN